MKVSIQKTVDYGHIDPLLRQKPVALARALQEAAVGHSEAVGLGSQKLLETGAIWILHRLAIGIGRYARLGEELTVTTWHRGSKGFKATRDFTVEAGGEVIARATSVWFFLNLEKKRLMKVPAAMMETYGTCPEPALEVGLDAWKPGDGPAGGFTMPISTRASDYDPLGHVNNSVYLDYLETLLFRAEGSDVTLKNLLIQFTREIGKQVEEVSASLSGGVESRLFSFSGPGVVFARGEVETV